MVSKKNKKGKYSDPKSRSKEDWEGRGKRKGNPYYKPVNVIDKNGVKRKVYKKRK